MGTITYTIPGVPLLDQLHSPTSDGLPDENARNNCVFASNAALATAYLHRAFNGDQLKDSDPAYGQGYTGGASEKNLVGTMLKLGIQMTRVVGATQADLVATIHAEVSRGHGVIVTMPSQWDSAVTLAGDKWNPRTYSGPSHVGLAYGIGDGMIRVMNPWGGFNHDGDDSYWALRLLEGEVWVGTMTTRTQIIPSGWKDDGKTLIAPNGVSVVLGYRVFVLEYPGGWEADNFPLAPVRIVEQLEWGNLTHGPGSRQDFRYRSLAEPHNVQTDTWGAVYRVWIGQDVLALSSQLDAANGHVSALETQVSALQQQIDQLKQQVDPKASEALVAVLEMAKALRMVGGTSPCLSATLP